jgi:integrator complex subunit 9
LARPEDCLRQLKYEWGSLDVDLFVQKLKQEGISDAKVEHSNAGFIIHLVRLFSLFLIIILIIIVKIIPFFFLFQQEEDTLIQVDDKSTHIYCEAADRQLRLKLRNILMQCLNTF